VFVLSAVQPVESTDDVITGLRAQSEAAEAAGDAAMAAAEFETAAIHFRVASELSTAVLRLRAARS
jgi:hypothetical protein